DQPSFGRDPAAGGIALGEGTSAGRSGSSGGASLDASSAEEGRASASGDGRGSPASGGGSTSVTSIVRRFASPMKRCPARTLTAPDPAYPSISTEPSFNVTSIFDWLPSQASMKRVPVTRTWNGPALKRQLLRSV